MDNIPWDECQAYAHHVDEQGRETTVACNLELHADPADDTARHYDDTLDIYWQYAEGHSHDGEE
jgi:hypothetical protein